VGVFRGNAVVVLPNGAWFQVTAALESVGAAGSEAWRGTVTAQHAAAVWDVMHAGRAELRLADGWAGEFVSPHLEGHDGRTMRVLGYGRVPF
jgi:hypothetical protein